MSLPINDEDNEKLLCERPGDDLYPKVKDKVAEVKENEIELKEKLIALILEDMTADFALSNGIDSVGEVIEYLSQDYKIERPSFDGKALLRDLSRIGKLNMSLKYADLLGIEGDVLDAVMKAEIERLWGDTALALLRRQAMVDRSANIQGQQPPENGVRKTVE